MAIVTGTVGLNEISDTDWIRQSFFVSNKGKNRPNIRQADMDKSSAYSYQSLSFADTTPGGNGSFGCKPQFTHNADILLPSLLLNGSGTDKNNVSLGMGRCYAERIHANADRITMQFCIPKFNSVTNYLTSFYDPDHGNMATTGRVNGDLFYTAGKIAGFIFIWSVVPLFCVTSLLYSTTNKFIRDALGMPMYKFYYGCPAMALYWSTVTTMVNAITVNMGLGQGVNQTDVSRVPGKEFNITSDYGRSAEDIRQLNKILPDIVLDSNGGIDPRRIAGRYQRMADENYRILSDIFNNSSDSGIEAALESYLNGTAQKAKLEARREEVEDFAKYMDGYLKSASGLGSKLIDSLMDTLPVSGDKATDDITAQATANSAASTATIGESIANFWYGLKEHMIEYHDFALGELRSGSATVSFIVDHDQNSSESFSNTTRSSDLANKINSTSQESRAKWFNLANGNIGDGAVSNTIETIAGSVKSLVEGGLDSIGFGGLSVLGGKAFADIPDFWNESSTNFNSTSYTMELRTPYGNSISVLLNIVLPMCMLIAGVAPRSSGRNSYTGPFLCKLWQKGKAQIQLGMITDLTLRRGAGNVGWNVNRQALAVDISFTVKNLSNITHVPITNELRFSDLIPGQTMFDEDTNYTDFMAVLGSLGVSEQFYASDRWRLRRARTERNFDTFLSPEHFLQVGIDDTKLGNLLSLFARKGAIR